MHFTIVLGLVLISAESKDLTGKIIIDGSSTVFPISEAVGEEFQRQYPKTRIAVASSGTGGGFKKFCKGEVDITGASRPIEATEMKLCDESGVQFVELPVAYDGITVLVHPENNWLAGITVHELKKIWESNSSVKKWSDLRPTFPHHDIKLFGPGHDSGTFDYFTKAINGKEKSSRSDFTASEDDNTLVKAISGDKYSLGYLGYAYYKSNLERLRAVPVHNGNAFVQPTEDSISQSDYRPLSRPVFIYVSQKSLIRDEVVAFASFYLSSSTELVADVGYIPLPPEILSISVKRFQQRVLGSIYSEDDQRFGIKAFLVESAKR